jgi:hypothetical protein
MRDALAGGLKVLAGASRCVAGAQQWRGSHKRQQGKNHTELSSHASVPFLEAAKKRPGILNGCISLRSSVSEWNRILIVIDLWRMWRPVRCGGCSWPFAAFLLYIVKVREIAVATVKWCESYSRSIAGGKLLRIPKNYCHR